jgi:hypothetical protein
VNNIRTPITIGVVVIVLMVTFASLSQTYASLLSEVANGAQDVNLTDCTCQVLHEDTGKYSGYTLSETTESNIEQKR